MTATTKNPSSKITLNSIVTQAEDQVSTDIDGEVVLMGIENGNYYGFDKILSRIWTLIETPTTISSLIEQLMQEYDVERSECESDVLSVLNEMLEDKLISIQ